ncbi:class I SAM-dependent methyltransferase [Microbacter margulisiae]|uniref:SAM-dependent methyltransferase n=1 Tax=Microbacter margulisiae TaxID=1350067 RepID=A0A7W5DNY6_9PORP|nr:class I SAM-dependent methyltransferase [Microbacter margulisiae]MBB3186053.1 SAM-dependent methyltransferase [Microbacter margulisiae]
MKKIIRLLLNHIPRKYLQLFSHFVLRISSIFYRGHKIECPVCHHHFRKLLPYGYVSSRENALCPSCLSLERHRQIWLFLDRKTGFFHQQGKMLHIAPEYCFIKRFQQLTQLDYYSADLESPLARVKMDIQNIPFEDNTFDMVMSNHILEHVDDDRLAMQELYRVMKPGGWGIIQSPVNLNRTTTYEDKSITTPEERLRHFGQKDHQREYGRDYADRLRTAGFEVSEIPLASFINENEALLYALTPNAEAAKDTIIYFVQKNM